MALRGWILLCAAIVLIAPLAAAPARAQNRTEKMQATRAQDRAKRMQATRAQDRAKRMQATRAQDRAERMQATRAQDRAERMQATRAQDRAERMQGIRAQAPPSLRSWIKGLPPAQRRLAAGRLRRMNDAQRARFFERWEGLSSSEREAFQQRMQRRADRRQSERAESGRAQRRGSAFARNLERWNELSDADKRKLRRRLRSFQELPAPQQEALVERSFAGRSAEERSAILERLRRVPTR